jgi:hypothetical protein
VDPENDNQWLEIIGRSLAYLCLQQVSLNDAERVPDIPAKVKFLEDIGLTTKDAAKLLGTTANSVKTNIRRRERKGKVRAKK